MSAPKAVRDIAYPEVQASVLRRIAYPIFEKKNVNVFIKRDDLIHPAISGNKWRKLRCTLSSYQSGKKQRLVTFGGPYSNHIYATAAACALHRIPVLGIIRGERVENETLNFAKACGMELAFVSRSDYRQFRQGEYGHSTLIKSTDYIVPEGGASRLALRGVGEMVEEVVIQNGGRHPDIWVVAAGTGTTAAGILMNTSGKVLAVPVLKGDFMEQEILKWSGARYASRLQVLDAYHFGGYARHTETLLSFMNDFHAATDIPLDFVYTAKAMYALVDSCLKDVIKHGQSVVFVHTGGLQGNRSLGESIAF